MTTAFWDSTLRIDRTPALATMNGPPILNIYGFKDTGFNTRTASDAGVHNFNPDTFKWHHDMI